MIDPAWTSLLIAVPATIVHLVLAGLLLRATRQRGVLAVFAGPALVLFAMILWIGGATVSFWHFAAFFSCGATFNLFLYGAVLKSLSLGMLAELALREGGHAAGTDLAADVIRPAFAGRIDILLRMGYVVPASDGYAITTEGAQTAERLKTLRARLDLDGLGLYGMERPGA